MPARILIIEDNPENLELMIYLLNAYGHTPLVARDGYAGLAAAQREIPDLIICDIQLPGIDGYEIARQLKADPALCNIPRVAVTAYAMVGDRNKVLEAGFDGYLSKPIDPETFVSQIDTFLRPPLRAGVRRTTSGPASSALASAPAIKGTIMVVDDSPANLGVFFSLFEPLGYRVISATNVSEALALAGQTLPDIIVSDLHIGRENGCSLLNAVRADPRLKGIPFVFISSTMLDPRQRDEALQLGAVKFIVRPIEPELLLAEIETCLRNGRAR